MTPRRERKATQHDQLTIRGIDPLLRGCSMQEVKDAGLHLTGEWVIAMRDA